MRYLILLFLISCATTNNTRKYNESFTDGRNIFYTNGSSCWVDQIYHSENTDIECNEYTHIKDILQSSK